VWVRNDKLVKKNANKQTKKTPRKFILLSFVFLRLITDVHPAAHLIKLILSLSYKVNADKERLTLANIQEKRIMTMVLFEEAFPSFCNAFFREEKRASCG
jgi:hypothetical protein